MRILVTAGPTREAIDIVRFISNRSSGRMGYAIARVGARRGHEIRLVSGPVCLAPPAGVGAEHVTSAAEMLAALMERVAWCDVLIMTAAVADWRPAHPVAGKLKKADGTPQIELVRTPDILEEVGPLKGDRLFVGFAAEAGDPVPEARRKLRDKGLDLVVANDIARRDSGFETSTNRVSLVHARGVETLPLLPKEAVAEHILVRVEAMRRRAGH